MKSVPRTELDFHPDAQLDWVIKNIPAELQLLPQWKLCYPLNSLVDGKQIQTAKRPINGPTTMGAMKLADNYIPDPDVAINRYGDLQHFGLCFTEDDEIVGIDVDDLPHSFTEADLPQSIRSILVIAPTYAEVSPSGQGLHVFYRTNKQLLSHRAAADKGVQGFKGAVYIRNQFMTFTGHVFTALSVPNQTIAQIDAHVFEKLILQPTNVTPLPTATFPAPAGTAPQDRNIPSITLLENWLSEIPASLSASPLKDRFYEVYRSFNPPMETPSDYDHWRTVAAATHYGAALSGQVHEGALLFDDWSARDPHGYESSQAAQKKYYDNAPRFNDTDITHATLAALAAAAIPQWPYPLTDAKGKIHTKIPAQTNLHNFVALLKHYNLSLAMNEITKEIVGHGNPALTQRHFKGALQRQDLETCVLSLCHDTYFQKVGSSVAGSFAKWMARNECTTFNPIKQWIDAAPDFNPKSHPSYFNQLFETLVIPRSELDRSQLFRTYLKKSLMGVIRAHYYHGGFAATTGIVILQGPEQTYKSTWVRQLLPLEFRHYIFNSQSKLGRNDNVKEIQLETGVAQIWLRDEVEALLQSGDAALKNLLVQETDAYRPLYGTTPISVPRKCIFWGTTNVRELPITDDGSRRIQIIPVEKCDTKAQADIDMVMVYKELLWEFNKTKDNVHELWTLTKEEITETNLINSTARKADQDADVYLKECYDFAVPYDLQTFMGRNKGLSRECLTTMREVAATIRDICGVTLLPKQLKHALARQCGQWTGTAVKPRSVGATIIDRGLGKVLKTDGTASASGWILPPKVTQFPSS